MGNRGQWLPIRALYKAYNHRPPHCCKVFYCCHVSTFITPKASWSYIPLTSFCLCLLSLILRILHLCGYHGIFGIHITYIFSPSYAYYVSPKPSIIDHRLIDSMGMISMLFQSECKIWYQIARGGAEAGLWHCLECEIAAFRVTKTPSYWAMPYSTSMLHRIL